MLGRVQDSSLAQGIRHKIQRAAAVKLLRDSDAQLVQFLVYNARLSATSSRFRSSYPGEGSVA
jgi:hypothetical protein